MRKTPNVIGLLTWPQDAAASLLPRYGMFRDIYHKPRSINDLKHHLMDIEIDTFIVKGGPEAAGKSLADLQMRKKFGFTALFAIS